MPKSIGLARVRAAVAALGIGTIACSASALAQESSSAPPDAPAPAGDASTPGTDASAPGADTSTSGTAAPGGDAPASAPASSEAAAPAPDATTPATDTAAPAPGSAPTATVPVAAAPTTQPAHGQQLEDIIVTATKREKSLREIAGSIGEFNGAELEKAGKWGLADYIEEKPGVTMTTLGPHMVKINVRGIASDAYFGAPLPSPVGMFIGDTAFNDPFITNVQPDLSAFDLSRVEILKGPQGTLFGGAALAGAVRYVLQEPVLGEWQARSFSQYDAPAGGTAVFSEGAAFNAPLLTDSLAMRLGYVKRKYPGVYDNLRMGTKDVDYSDGNQIRGLFTWQPSDALGVKYTHLRQDSFTPFANPIADSPDGPRQTSLKVLPQPSFADIGMDSLEVGYDFDNMRLVALTSRTAKNWYVDVDITYVITGPPGPGFDPQNGSFQTTDDRSKSQSEELRLQSTGKDGLQWLVGVYNVDYKVFFEILDDTVANHDQQMQLGVDPATYHETTLFYGLTNVKAFERAGFLDLGYKFWDRLDLSAGARYYVTQVKGGFFGAGEVARQENGGQDFDFSGNDITEKGLNPKFTATYEFTRDVSTYVSASRGFRFGGLQTVPSSQSNGVPPRYKSDSIWNYELGTRTNWFDNTLHFDTTVFYIDYKNPQIVLRTNSSTGLNLAYTDNVKHAVSKGFESAIEWLTPLDGVRLELTGGYTDSHITVPFQAPDPYVGGCGCTIVPAGAWMPGVARYQYMGAIGYTAPQIGIFDIGGRVDYTYIGKGVGTIIQERKINDYGTLNAGITLATSAWRLKPQLALNVSNILDVTAVKLGYTVKAVPGELSDVWYLNQPRTYSMRLGLDF